jgi:hypothetical protein
MRRAIYSEIVCNFASLQGIVFFAEKDAILKPIIGENFRRGFKRVSYDFVLREAALYYSLGHPEIDWIDSLYRGWEQVINGDFRDDETRFRNASFYTHMVLSFIKNRQLSKRLIFSVSPRWVRRHCRGSLPSVPYVDIEPPGKIERVRRRLDCISYCAWKKLRLD